MRSSPLKSLDAARDYEHANYNNLNICILGASYAGLATCQRIYRELLPQLKTYNKHFSYRITLVAPSTHLYWNISAPRDIVSQTQIKHDQTFIPIHDGLKGFRDDDFEYIQGAVTDLDTNNCSITVDCPLRQTKLPANDDPFMTPSLPSQQRVVKYHALVVATGSTAHSSLLSLRGSHNNTMEAIDNFQARLVTAESVIIAGGGPSGIEIAGQIAHYYNNKSKVKRKKTPQQDGIAEHKHDEALPTSSPSRASSPSKLLARLSPGKSLHPQPCLYSKDILLLASSSELLPHLNSKVGPRARHQLESLGVRVITDTFVETATSSSFTNKTVVKLNNGTSLTCDIYIPATGVTPNTQWLPTDSPMLEQGFVATIADDNGYSTMRVYVPPEGLAGDTIFVEEPGTNSVASVDDLTGSPRRLLNKANTTPQTPQSADFLRTPLPRIYAIGDCASYSQQCILDAYAPIPTLLANLAIDLKAYQLAISNPYGGNKAEIFRLYMQSVSYRREVKDNQLVPIGGMRPAGVGVLKGVGLPGLAVWALKGREYTVDRIDEVVRMGVSPYPGQSGQIGSVRK